MSGNNILEPIPPYLRDYLLKYDGAELSNTLPAAPDGATNVQWQMDGFGHISANYTGGGGVTLPANAAPLATDADGNPVAAAFFNLNSGEFVVFPNTGADAVAGWNVANHQITFSPTVDGLQGAGSNSVGFTEGNLSGTLNGAFMSYSYNPFGVSNLPAFIVGCLNSSSSTGFGSLFTVNTDASIYSYATVMDDGKGNYIQPQAGTGISLGHGINPAVNFGAAVAIADQSASNMAPLGFTAQASLLSAPVSGTFEFDGTHLYFNIAGTRHTIV